MPIPFLDLITPHLELEEEILTVVRNALHTGRFVGGPEVEGFEKEYAEFCRSHPLRSGKQRHRRPPVRVNGRRHGPG